MAGSGNKTEPDNPLFWGPKHEIFYANAFHFRINDNDISIELGTIQNMNDTEALLSTHQVIMTFRSAKLLAITLSQAVNAVEGRYGEIKINAEKIAALQAALAEWPKKISGK